MKKLFTLLVLMCLLGVNRIWAQFNPMSMVVNTGTTIVYQGQLPSYTGNGGDFFNKSNWELIPSGNIQSATFSSNSFDINITYKDVVDSEKGGAITVIFNKNKNFASYYVITIPYSGNHVWNFEDFDHTGSIPQDEGSVTPTQNLHWVQDWKSKPSSGAQNNQHPIMVASPHDSNLEGSYNSIWGTNAYYIPETAGLLFETNSRNFGYNGTNPNGNKKYVTWGGRDPRDNSGYNPTFKIPQVQGGKYIKVWWDGMSEGRLGANFKVENLLDLEGVEILNSFPITGVCWNAAGTIYYGGCVIFKVKGSSSERKDVVFKLTDTGWNDLYRIEVTDQYSTDMILLQQIGGNKEVKYNNDQGSFVVEESELNQGPHYYSETDKPYLTFCGANAYTRIERAKTCEFTVVQEPEDGVVSYVQRQWNSGGADYYNLDITQIKGSGNIKVIQRVKYGDYVLDKNETWLAFGTYKQQSYPYTWDFMDWNMKQKQMLGVLDDSHTHGISYGYWNTATDNVRSLETHELVDASKVNNSYVSNYVWNNVPVDRPLFAQGAQLSYRDYDQSQNKDEIVPFKEAEGLRMKQFWGNEIGVGPTYDGEISLDGNFLKYNPTVDGHKLVITIPNVPTKKNNEDMWLFVKSSVAPQSVYAATDKANPVNISASVPTKCNLNDDVKAYKITSEGDVEILFTKATSISAIGVTHIFKSINALGYATESRDVDIDHEYEGVFTKNDVNAYCIQTYDDNGFTYEYKRLPQVKKSTRVHMVPKNTGIVLYADVNPSAGTQFNVPLFYPACNNAKLDMSDNSAEYKAFRNNWMAPCVEEYTHTSETVNRLDAMKQFGENGIAGYNYGTNNDNCTKFVMSSKYYVYHKTSTGGEYSDIQVSTDPTTGAQTEAFVRMNLNLANSGVANTSNTMGANKAYLLIPTSKMPTALWNGGNGEGNPGYAKPGVIFMDLEDLFGGEEPISGIATAIDTIESAETVDKGNTYYTISGMKIQGIPTEKGVYILNGKKVMVK